MPRLQVMVGPDRFHMEPCRVNDTHRPHEIDTEHFTGRVLVRILDAPGAKEGQEGREYFKDRSRKFCIQIEGRFKKRCELDAERRARYQRRELTMLLRSQGTAMRSTLAATLTDS